MKRIRMAALALAATGAAFLSAAPTAGAAVTVIGSGLARDCYHAVEDARVPDTEALELCTLALEQESLGARDRAATYANRGIVQMRMGRNARALSDFERGLRVKDTRLETQVNRGAALYGLKRYDEALAALDEGINVEKLEAKAIAFYNRALVKERMGDTSGAYYDFRTAAETDPAFELARRQLARFRVEPAG